MENWEASKENVLPLKRGRNVKELNETLEKVDTMKGSALFSMQESVFEASVNDPNKSPLELLDAYSSFVKWTQDTFPSNSDKTLKLLEVISIVYVHININDSNNIFFQVCTCRLKDFEELKNDPRFIKLWVAYVSYYSYHHQSTLLTSLIDYFSPPCNRLLWFDHQAKSSRL